MGRKLGVCPFGGGELGPHLTQCGTMPTCMPSFILIRQTVWPQYTEVTDRQTDRQRSDSIGRTVLQTVAQKTIYCTHLWYPSFGTVYIFLTCCQSCMQMLSRKHVTVLCAFSVTVSYDRIGAVSHLVTVLLNLQVLGCFSELISPAAAAGTNKCYMGQMWENTFFVIESSRNGINYNTRMW